MSSFSVQTFTNTTALSAGTPAANGQLAVEQSLNKLWRGFGTNTGDWNEIGQTLLNVKDFQNTDGSYVQGDGTNDDTTGIQAAIDSLNNSADGVWVAGTQQGETIYFPPGMYKSVLRSVIVPFMSRPGFAQAPAGRK